MYYYIRFFLKIVVATVKYIELSYVKQSSKDVKSANTTGRMMLHQVKKILRCHFPTLIMYIMENKGMGEFAKRFHPKKVLLVGTGGISFENFLKINPKELF